MMIFLRNYFFFLFLIRLVKDDSEITFILIFFSEQKIKKKSKPDFMKFFLGFICKDTKKCLLKLYEPCPFEKILIKKRLIWLIWSEFRESFDFYLNSYLNIWELFSNTFKTQQTALFVFVFSQHKPCKCCSLFAGSKQFEFVLMPFESTQSYCVGLKTR